MASTPNQLHFVLIPLMAQGHMIPMIDMAKLLAERGVIVTIVTTPLNASRFAPIVNQAVESGLPIQVSELPFPCQEAGLPVGCESLDVVPSRDLIRNFYFAVGKLQQPLEQYLQEQKLPPSCIISDKYLAWTLQTAQKFRIPRIVFHGTCCFSLLSSHNIKLYNAQNSIILNSEKFLIPGMPQKIEITKAQLPGEFVLQADMDDIRGPIQEAELASYGVVVNSFNELEPQFVEGYRNALHKKVWCIGPVSLCNKAHSNKFERGNRASIEEKECLGWLDSKKPCSVIYACLGSQCRLVASQLIELGLGLEASNHPFIWVIKTEESMIAELEEWLKENKFEERINGRGLLIKGWAPQVLVLSHKAIKGFLTHCGWNSTIEGICSGVPMITWPLFAEQFLNEKLIVEVLRIGVRIGVQLPTRWGEEEKVGVLVKREDVEQALKRLMDGAEEGENRRKRARQLGEKAKETMEEGGSSHLGITLLIQDIIKQSELDKRSRVQV